MNREGPPELFRYYDNEGKDDYNLSLLVKIETLFEDLHFLASKWFADAPAQKPLHFHLNNILDQLNGHRREPRWRLPMQEFACLGVDQFE